MAAPPDILIRPVQSADAEKLHEACFPHLSLSELSRRFEIIIEGYDTRRICGMVAEVSSDIVGYGQIGRWGPNCEISDLIVAEGWRSNGIGSALIAHLLDVAREWEISEVQIGAAETNPGAYRLYKRLGFNEYKRVMLDIGSGPEPIIYLNKQFSYPEAS